RAAALAHRLTIAASPPMDELLPQVWGHVLGRPPREQELTEAREFLAFQQEEARAAGLAGEESARRALADLIQMLLSSNEFLYVE
ncbi:MAG: hypothetical protein ACK5EA_10205, partial [Planctomycetaceae bacterium]